jgi:hypothetical protein
MTKLLLALFLAIVIVAPELYPAGIDQAGSAASGRSSRGNLRLETVLGQTAGGRAGRLTSGFFAQQALPNYLPGDVNFSGTISVSDVVFLINYIFSGGQAPRVLASADADCSHAISISDAVYLLRYIFAHGPSPHYCE